MFVNEYPYTDNHQLNLDWILMKIHELIESWNAEHEKFQQIKVSFEELKTLVNQTVASIPGLIAAEVPAEVFRQLQQMYVEGKLTTANANILINPDFKINQRGQSEYTSGYTVDHWRCAYNPNNCSLHPVNTGIQKLGEGMYYLAQYFENNDIVGKMLTLTVSVNGVEYTGHGIMPDNDTVYLINNSDIACYLQKGSASGNKPSVVLRINTNNVVNYAKLEYGEIATRFESPDPAIELLRCQRYYAASINDGDGRTSNQATAVTANFLGGFKFPTTMRVNPTVNVTVRDFLSLSTLFAVDTKQALADGITYMHTTVALTPGRNYMINYTADAELY